MVSRYIHFFTILQLLCLLCQAQSPFISKLNNYNSFNNNNITPLNDGGFITQEATYDNHLKIVLTRFSKNHHIEWTKQISMPGYDKYSSQYYDFTSVNDNSFYLATINYLPNDKHWLITKLNGEGRVQWTKKIQLKHSNFDNLFIYQKANLTSHISGTTTADSGYVFGFGYFQHFLQDTSYFSIAKLNRNGSLAWLNTYSTNVLMNPVDCISQVRNGNQEKYIFATGRGMLTFNKQGSLINYKTFYKDQVSTGHGITPHRLANAENNSLYCASIYDNDLTLIKIDSNQSSIWARNYDTSKATIVPDITIDTDNPIILYKRKLKTSGSPVTSTALIKIDNKKVITSKSLGTENYNHNFLNNMLLTKDSGTIFMLQDTLWNNTILKTDQNLNTPCHQQNIQVQVDSFNVIDQQLPFPTPTDSIEYRFSDTTVAITDVTNQETIICSQHPIPKLRLKDTILCNAQSQTLEIDKDSSHFDLQWSTGDTSSSITIDSSGNYWASSSYDTITVTDTAQITFLADIKTGLPDDTSFCPYDSLKLNVENPANANFTWITPEKDSTGKNIEEQGKAIWAQDTGSYYLKVQETTHCKPVDTIHLNHHPLPSADAGPDTTLCHNQTYTMQGKGGITYKWIPARYLSNDSIAKPKAELPNQQRYKLIVSNQQGCRDTSDVLINVRDSLKVALSPHDKFVCNGTPVKLNANPTGGYSPNYQYHWLSDTTSTPSIKVAPAKSGWHRVTLKDYCSQPAKDSIYIEVAQPPIADFTTSPQDTAHTNQEIRFFNQSTNAVRYSWNFGKPGLNSSRKNPVHGYQDSGTYPVKLQAYGQADCGTDINLDTLHVIDTTSQFEVYIPDAFSPNHDGTNDEWKIKGVGIQAIHFDIYNRWGQQVFSANNQRTWDGRFRKSDQKVKEGVYLYLVKITDPLGNPHYYSGEIHVIQ